MLRCEDRPVMTGDAARVSAPRARACVIVAGMHRSGTSAVTRVVNLLGADISRALIPPRPDNERGYWESGEIVAIHNRLLDVLGSASEDPLRLPGGWLETSAAREARIDLARLIARDFDDSRTFVVKDPRISRLLPLWLELLDGLGIDAVVVIPFRNPLEVAASLAKRDRLGLSKSLLLYIESYLDIERVSRGRPRCFERYNKLLADWRVLDAKLAKLLGPRLPPAGTERAAEIDRFLTSDLYHHRHSRDDLAATPDIAAMVVAMFDLMNGAADTGDERELRAAFDHFGAVAAEAARLYQGIVIAERAEFRQELARFERSASWRLTAPLRWANQQRRRVRQLFRP